MTDRLCENCKEYSLMNAFCKVLQIPKKPKEACAKFIPFDDKLPCAKTKHDCDNCDGTCDCHDDNYGSSWCQGHYGGCDGLDD